MAHGWLDPALPASSAGSVTGSAVMARRLLCRLHGQVACPGAQSLLLRGLEVGWLPGTCDARRSAAGTRQIIGLCDVMPYTEHII